MLSLILYYILKSLRPLLEDPYLHLGLHQSLLALHPLLAPVPPSSRHLHPLVDVYSLTTRLPLQILQLPLVV